jgi:hypothetical protein
LSAALSISVDSHYVCPTSLGSIQGESQNAQESYGPNMPSGIVPSSTPSTQGRTLALALSCQLTWPTPRLRDISQLIVYYSRRCPVRRVSRFLPRRSLFFSPALAVGSLLLLSVVIRRRAYIFKCRRRIVRRDGKLASQGKRHVSTWGILAWNVKAFGRYMGRASDMEERR